MRRRSIVLLLAFLMAFAVLPAASAGAEEKPPRNNNACENRNNNTVKKLLECVTVEGVREHQAAFQAIADDNGGTRAASTGGYDDSVAYVVDRMTAAGYDVTIDEFDFDFFELLSQSFAQTSSVARTFTPTTDYDVMTYSGSGVVVDTAVVATNDVIIPFPPAPNTSTSGCEPADFDPGTAGNVALIQRGTCDFVVKAANAEAAGAVAAIVFNEGQPGRDGVVFGTLGSAGINIPVIGISYDLGVELYNDAAARVSMNIQTISETRTTANVLAESTSGRDDNVVMAGAHLDSVPQGPGVQDNGSGSAALLEIAENMAKVKPVNKVRFAWWGAEELGLLGSIDYILSLTDEEHANIALYLNFDMIGSPNFARFVYDGDNSDGGNTIFVPPESAVIEQLFLDYYASQGLPNQGTLLGQRSDHFAFCVTGIPCGGLFTGAEGIKTVDEAALYGGTAGDQYDPCYHTACDTFANVSLTALDQNSDAAAFAILTYGMNTETVNGVSGKGNFSPENQLKPLTQLSDG